MNKMSHQFSEIRWNLGLLATRPLRPLILVMLQKTMRDLRALREHWFKPKPALVPIAPVTVLPQRQAPIISPPAPVLEDPPRRKRPVSTSTTYNAELVLPYRILWAKVIVRAAYDYALWKDSPDIRLRRFAEDAERWLFERDDYDLELSFENICFAFDFPVEKIRKKTRTLTREDVKKLEFRERQGRSELLGEISGGDSK